MTPLLFQVLFGASSPAHACDGPSCTHTLEERRAWIREQFEAAEGTKVKYRVVGLDCAGCPKKLRKALLARPSIDAVMIEGDAVHIAYDPARIEHRGLLEAIRSAGDFRELVLGKGPIPSVQTQE